MTITHNDEILGGEARIEGTRVGVRHISAMIIDGGRSPAYVADQLAIPIARVYKAMAYYYDNMDEIHEYDREQREVRENLREDFSNRKNSSSDPRWSIFFWTNT